MSPDAQARRRAAVLVLWANVASAAVESVAGPVLRRYSPYQVVWSRYAIHLLLVLAWQRGSAPWRTRRPALQILASLCMVAMPHYFVVGARSMAAENVWAFFWTSPLLALSMGWLALGERPIVRTWFVSAACFAASLLILAEKPFPPLSQVLAPLAMALSFAVYLVLLRMLREESTASKLFYTALGVFLALSPAMPGRFVLPDLRAALTFVVIAVLGLVFLALLDRALEGASVATAAPFVYSMPLWHVVIATMLGYWPGRRATAGAFALAVALLVAFRWEGRSLGPVASDAGEGPSAIGAG